MTSIAPPFVPPSGLAAPPSAGASAGAATPAAGTSDARALEAAREFEKLLIHDLLKTARRAGATLGETPSNARATYDDMMDERMAEIVSEAGGFGLAPMLAERLGGGTDRPSNEPALAAGAPAPASERLVSVVADGGARAGPTARLDTSDLRRLRALVRPDGQVGSTGARRPDSPTTGVAGIRPLALDIHRSGIGAAGASDATPAVARTDGASSIPGGEPTRDDAHRAFLAPLLPEASRSARRLGTSPDVVLAVAALESGWGEHVAADAQGRSSHNLFGIKARPGEADAVSHVTTEYLGGRRHRVVADFRAFADPAAAVGGFADFVLDNPRYARALEHADDPPEFLRRLHAAGYATDPRYADKAIAVMQRVRALRENPA